MKTIDKICPVCSISYNVPYCHSNRYLTCSYKCGGIHRKKPAITLICNNCKKEFISKKSPRHIQKYCSRKCSQTSHKNGSFEKCLNCSSEIYVPVHRQQGQWKKKYCSQKCRLQHWNKSSLQSQRPGCYRQNAWKTYEKKCYDCGYNHNIQILVIHHIDGDRENGKISNLIPLCQNCHCIRHIQMAGNAKIPSARVRKFFND